MGGKIDGAHHLRSAPRYKLFQPTELRFLGVVGRVHLLNISTGGALIYAADAPEPGVVVRLRCGERWLPARVAWRNQRRVGLTFATPLTDADVQAIIAAEEEAMAAASRRLGGTGQSPASGDAPTLAV